MKTRCFTVVDVKVGAYLLPFFMRSNAEAIRAFGDAVNDSSTQFYRHPEDYCLFCIGEFDDSTGVLVPLAVHESLGKAVEYLNRPTTVDLFTREAG